MSVDTVKQPNWFSRLAHPGQFLAWSRYLVWPLAIATLLSFAIGLWFAFFNSPEDYQMGDMVRVMYVHVPNAWLSQLVYGVMAVSALGTLVWRHPLADVANKAAAPLGAVFTALALYTGSLWGRPTWGTFWEWDGRMTSTLVLLLIYLGIIALWRAFDDQLKAGADRRHRDAGRGAEHPGNQILGRLVEHPAPAGERVHCLRAEDAGLDPDAAAGDDAGLHAAVRIAAGGADADRDFAPPGRDAEPAGRLAGSRQVIAEGAHLEFIVWAYAGVAVLTLALIGYVAWDARRVKQRLAELDKAGIRRRSAGSNT